MTKGFLQQDFEYPKVNKNGWDSVARGRRKPQGVFGGASGVDGYGYGVSVAVMRAPVAYQSNSGGSIPRFRVLIGWWRMTHSGVNDRSGARTRSSL
jgi:hypothetical protein